MTSSIRLYFQPRFSLGAMLVLITVIAIPLSYVAQRRAVNARRWEVYSELSRVGVYFYEPGKTEPLQRGTKEGPSWRRTVFDPMPPIQTVEVGDGTYFGWFTPISDAELEQLTVFREVECIRICGAFDLSEEGLRCLAQFPKLRQLEICHHSKLTGRFLADLKECDHLESLELRDLAALEGEPLSSLEKFPKLRELTLETCAKVNSKSLSAVNLPRQLESLKLGNCSFGSHRIELEIGDANLRRWLERTRLKQLSLDIPFSRAIAPALATQVALEKLEITNAPLEDEDLVFLGRCAKLVDLSLIALPANGRFLDAFSERAAITSLTLRSMPISDEQAAKAARLASLRSLDLGWTLVDGGFLSPPPASSLRVLRLNGTEFSGEGKAHLCAIEQLGLVAFPGNWTALDLRRYRPRAAPAKVVLNYSYYGEAKSRSIAVTDYYPDSFGLLPERPGPDDFGRFGRCPMAPMKAVIGLHQRYQQERHEARKEGASE